MEVYEAGADLRRRNPNLPAQLREQGDTGGHRDNINDGNDASGGGWLTAGWGLDLKTEAIRSIGSDK